MSFLPSFSLNYLLNLALFAAAARPYIPAGKRQMWVLSTVNGTLMSGLGLLELANWWQTGDLNPSPRMEAAMEFMKCYLLTDLAYNALFHFSEISFLEGWLHHSVYIFIFDQVVKQGLAGVLRPLLILEIPAAIRAWGSIYPALRSDLAFGVTFGALRVIYPFYIMFYLTIPTWSWIFMIAAQGLHIYWFWKWMQKYAPSRNVHLTDTHHTA
jgi:hypothetical protein